MIALHKTMAVHYLNIKQSMLMPLFTYKCTAQHIYMCYIKTSFYLKSVNICATLNNTLSTTPCWYTHTVTKHSKNIITKVHIQSLHMSQLFTLHFQSASQTCNLQEIIFNRLLHVGIPIFKYYVDCMLCMHIKHANCFFRRRYLLCCFTKYTSSVYAVLVR